MTEAHQVPFESLPKRLRALLDRYPRLVSALSAQCAACQRRQKLIDDALRLYGDRGPELPFYREHFPNDVKAALRDLGRQIVAVDRPKGMRWSTYHLIRSLIALRDGPWLHGLEPYRHGDPRARAGKTYAYCWTSGLIEFGPSVPDGAIKLAYGNDQRIRETVNARARHGWDGRLLVPGVPEAKDGYAAADAARSWCDWTFPKRTRLRAPCADWNDLVPLFYQAALDQKYGRLVPVREFRASLMDVGEFFLLRGSVIYIASVESNSTDPALRVVYSDATERDMLRSSLISALHKDKSARHLRRVLE